MGMIMLPGDGGRCGGCKVENSKSISKKSFRLARCGESSGGSAARIINSIRIFKNLVVRRRSPACERPIHFSVDLACHLLLSNICLSRSPGVVCNMSKPIKRDAIEAFGDDASTSKKRPRRKDTRRRSKPPVAGPQTTKPSSATPSKTSEAGTLKTEDLITRFHQPPRHEPGKKDGVSKEPGSKRKRKRVESRPETSQSAGQAHTVIKTEAKLEHEHGKIRRRKGKKLVEKSKSDSRNRRSRPPSESDWAVAIQGGFFIDQDPLLSKDEQ